MNQSFRKQSKKAEMSTQSNFVNLHSHTAYSMLDGFGKIPNYVEEARRQGMKALAITDHGNVHGWMDFYEECTKTHDKMGNELPPIKPILGIEAYQARVNRFNKDPDVEFAGGSADDIRQKGPYHLTVLAANRTGYHNLIKMSSRSYTEGFYGKPRIDHELLSEYSKGLIVLSGCLGGEVAQALLRDDFNAALANAATMQDIVGAENYFIEIMNHDIPEEKKVLPDLVRIAKMIGAKVVPTCDSHYVNRSDSKHHDVYLCVFTRSQITDENRFKFKPEEFYLKSDEDMMERFAPEFVKNSLHVADMVEDLGLKFNEYHFPDFDIPTDESTDEYLHRMVKDGVEKRYGSNPGNEVLARVDHEMGVISRMGFQSYFLVVSDLVRWAKDNGIRVGYGRGSAAGSIISYVLEITNLDPLRWGLMFERFLVEGRKSMPDIDLDFDDRYRDKVIDYARSKYGDEMVAHIGTFFEIKSKQAIKDAGKVFGFDFSVTNEVSALVPPPVLGVTKTIAEAKESTKFKAAYEANEDIRTIADAAEGLEGLIRQSGTHAAGVVITQKPVVEYVPIMQRWKGDEPVGPYTTQWPMDWVERNGLLKVDFLGLSNLAIIDICIEKVMKNRDELIDLEEVPLDDERTYADLCAGNGTGVFQLASSGMKSMMMALKPDRIEDIMALIALYRPGPLGSGMDKLYINRKHGRASEASRHPMLDELLEDTHGVMLYQENVLKVAKEMAGFDPGECDDLRKAVGKKQMDKISLFRSKFVEGCVSTSNIPAPTADKIFTDIEYHGGYSFNLAHSASYGMISYMTAYLKANYTTEYMAALLTHADNKEKAGPFLHECRVRGIDVIAPSINQSEADFRVRDNNTILFGLESISGISGAVVDQIVSPRDNVSYTNMYDFMRRADKQVLRKNILEHLTMSGAFDELAEDDEHKPLSREEKSNLLDMERKELGLYVSEHPLTDVWHNLSMHVDSEIANLGDLPNGSYVKVGGVLTSVIEKTTRSGNPMYIITIEDLSDSVEVLVFSRKFNEINPEVGQIMFIEGRLEHEGDEENPVSKLFYTASSFPDLPDSGERPVFLEYKEEPSRDHVLDIYRTMKEEDGDTTVYMRMPNEGKMVTVKYNIRTSPSIASKVKEIRNKYVL